MTLHVPNISSDAPSEARHHPVVPSVRKQKLYRSVLKRGIDMVLVLLSMPLVLPVIAVLALIILLTGNMPFYSQLRVGRGGVPFRMWKLRTMVTDADARLEDYLEKNPAARVEWDAKQKLKNDPRITSFGRILRKTSIDELPQLFNVLNGTMSLVGPRPMMVGQEKFYHGQAYYKLRPGITGIWQISDRNECSFQGRVDYDNAYYHDITLKTDMRILFQTIGVVCRATGH